MVEYCKGKPEDMEDIIDFANYIFSQSEVPHDFKKILPKIYSDDKKTAQYHYLVKDNGKIKSMILALPSQMKVGDTILNVCGLGTVSVHPYARGCGYMKELMNLALSDMKNSGCQLSVLGGQRQRYEYFGYEPCGMQVEFTITSTNVKHAYKSIDCTSISFEKMTLSDDELIEKAYNLHKAQNFAGVRNQSEFFDVLLSWQGIAYAVKMDNEFCGYLVRNGNSIVELLLSDTSKMPLVIKSLIEKEFLSEISIVVPLFEQDKLACLSKISEGYNLSINHSFNIFDYKTVIKAFMQLKSAYAHLPDGKLSIKIENQSILISVVENKISVEDYVGNPDIEFSHLDAMLHIFSPAGGFLKDSIELPQVAKTWFPLPLFMASLDCC